MPEIDFQRAFPCIDGRGNKVRTCKLYCMCPRCKKEMGRRAREAREQQAREQQAREQQLADAGRSEA